MTDMRASVTVRYVDRLTGPAKRSIAAFDRLPASAKRAGKSTSGAMDQAEIANMLKPLQGLDADSSKDMPHWVLSHVYFSHLQLVAAGSYGRVYVQASCVLLTLFALPGSVEP